VANAGEKSGLLSFSPTDVEEETPAGYIGPLFQHIIVTVMSGATKETVETIHEGVKGERQEIPIRILVHTDLLLDKFELVVVGTTTNKERSLRTR
jgi:hypothetical protein